MYFAHIVGEHHFHSQSEHVTHTLASWSGVIITVVIGLIVAAMLYHRKKVAKQDVSK